MFEGGQFQTLLGQQILGKDSREVTAKKTDEIAANTFLKQKHDSLWISYEDPKVDSPKARYNDATTDTKLPLQETEKEKEQIKNFGEENIPANMKTVHTDCNAAYSWNICIQKNDRHIAEQLISCGQLPYNEQLMEIYKVFGRKSDTVQKVFEKICAKLNEKIRGVKKIFPALKSGNSKDVIFVVVTELRNNLNDFEYNVEFVANGDGFEPPERHGKETLADVSLLGTKKMMKCINAIPDSFFENHRHVTSVSPSYIRSKKKGTLIVRENCIAIGVQCKGYIPIGEEELPKHIGLFPTDIRENYVHSCQGNSLTDFHKDVKIGCQISGATGKLGAIGCFLERSDFPDETFALTCAHVLLDDNTITKICQNDTFCRPEDGETFNCYQPSIDFGPCGEVKYACYNSQADIAIVRIDEDRTPKSGWFPDFDENTYRFKDITKKGFQTGQIFEEEKVGLDVCKVGPQSLLTSGVIKSYCSIIVVEGHVFRNMLEVVPDYEYEFSMQGDSGSCVFAIDNHEVFAVGILVGVDNNGHGFVTSAKIIASMLEKEGLSMKAFDKGGQGSSYVPPHRRNKGMQGSAPPQGRDYQPRDNRDSCRNQATNEPEASATKSKGEPILECTGLQMQKDEESVDEWDNWLRRTVNPESVDKLLNANILPNNEQLKKACIHFGRRSDIMQKICKKICENIIKETENIKSAYPSYAGKEENDIIFVIMCDKNITRKDYGYAVYYSCDSKFTLETKAFETKRRKEHGIRDFPTKVRQKINETMKNEITDVFYKEHRNVTSVSSRPLKSKGYRNDEQSTSHELIEQPCIVFTVSVKGYIPIDENPIPEYIGRFTTDVREGIFRRFVGNAAQMYHEYIMTGVAIGRLPISNDDKISLWLGTLGGFLENKSNADICYGITAAHAVLEDEEMQKMITEGGSFPADPKQPVTVFHPNFNIQKYECGHLHKAYYTKKVDAALFRVYPDRMPTSGKFPSLGEAGDVENISFSNVTVYTGDDQDLFEKVVKKFGAKTLMKRGQVVGLNATMIDPESNYYRIENQLEILSDEPTGEPFSSKGDSGALVFCTDKNDEPSVVGLIVGGDDFITNATPIEYIFDTIGDHNLSFKSFPDNCRLHGEEIHSMSVSEHMTKSWGESEDLNSNFSSDVMNTERCNETDTLLGEVNGAVDHQNIEVLKEKCCICMCEIT